MAAVTHSIYCFEVLAAHLDRRKPLDLAQVEESWAKYKGRKEAQEAEPDTEGTMDYDASQEVLVADPDGHAMSAPFLKPRGVSRLQDKSPVSASTASSSTTPSNNSSRLALDHNSTASSRTSLFSDAARPQDDAHPLFVTWNRLDARGRKSLRGCIGTFEKQELAEGLRSYALTAALEDVRFNPITRSELSSLANQVTLLLNFTPADHPLDWELGTHGIRISFTYGRHRYGSTYLPDVAPEQGWTKEETMVSLMRKAGWNGRSSEWRAVKDLKVIRYEGETTDTTYAEWEAWRQWVDANM